MAAVESLRAELSATMLQEADERERRIAERVQRAMRVLERLEGLGQKKVPLRSVRGYLAEIGEAF